MQRGWGLSELSQLADVQAVSVLVSSTPRILQGSSQGQTFSAGAGAWEGYSPQDLYNLNSCLIFFFLNSFPDCYQDFELMGFFYVPFSFFFFSSS